MKHKFIKVENFEILEGYKIRISFSDKEIRIVDFEPVLHGELFGPLRDRNVFKKMYIDEEVGTLVWECGADFDPDTLYNWDVFLPKLSNRLKSA